MMNHRNILSYVTLIALILIMSACTGQPTPPGGSGTPSDGGSGGSGSDDGGTSGGSGEPGETISLGDIMSGTQVWLSARCTECHTIGDDPGGNTGPELTGIGDRFTKDELKAWISNPQAVRPDADMPAQTLPEDDLEFLARYLSTLSSDTAFSDR